MKTCLSNYATKKITSWISFAFVWIASPTMLILLPAYLNWASVFNLRPGNFCKQSKTKKRHSNNERQTSFGNILNQSMRMRAQLFMTSLTLDIVITF